MTDEKRPALTMALKWASEDPEDNRVNVSGHQLSDTGVKLVFEQTLEVWMLVALGEFITGFVKEAGLRSTDAS